MKPTTLAIVALVIVVIVLGLAFAVRATREAAGGTAAVGAGAVDRVTNFIKGIAYRPGSLPDTASDADIAASLHQYGGL